MGGPAFILDVAAVSASIPTPFRDSQVLKKLKNVKIQAASEKIDDILKARLVAGSSPKHRSFGLAGTRGASRKRENVGEETGRQVNVWKDDSLQFHSCCTSKWCKGWLEIYHGRCLLTAP